MSIKSKKILPRFNQPISLYIHIPFCKKKCFYCAFYKEIHTIELERAFLDALEKECQFFYQTQGQKIKIKTLFIGGGTPTCLSPNGFVRLFQIIHHYFKISPKAEQTLEANPESIRSLPQTLLKESGVNRISLGVQSMHDSELKFLGRIHRAHDTYLALEYIKSCDITNFNTDIIFGLPGSTPDTLSETLTRLLAYQPTHISTYALSIEEQTRFYKENLKPISEEEDLKQYRLIRSFLKDYNQYEVSAFAQKGYRCKHNLTYWNFEDYLGLGPGAHSFLNKTRYFHKNSLTSYIQNPISKPIRQTSSDLLMEFIICQLRLLRGIPLKKAQKIFNIDLVSKFQVQWQELSDLGLIRLTPDYIRLTARGLYLEDEVLARIVGTNKLY